MFFYNFRVDRIVTIKTVYINFDIWIIQKVKWVVYL